MNTNINYHNVPYCPCLWAEKVSFLSKMSESKPLATVLFLHNPHRSILGLTHTNPCLLGRVHCSFCAFVGVRATSHSTCPFGFQLAHRRRMIIIFLMNWANPVKGWRIPQELYLVSWDVITTACVLWMRSPVEGRIKGSFTSVVFCLHIHLCLCEHLFHNNLLPGAFFPPLLSGV